MLKITTTYVADSSVSRAGNSGSDSASAIEIPPRNPPHVMIPIVAHPNLRSRGVAKIGPATLISRASRTMTIATMPITMCFTVKSSASICTPIIANSNRLSSSSMTSQKPKRRRLVSADIARSAPLLPMISPISTTAIGAET